MVLYGKYNSLTLVNWNGFFARTFELDELVTTLSGGNGAGKSTTMAAFVTALIPDLTLLHFRNTTEAGATTGSRDKGLHGKLRPGVCYAILDIQNSRNQRILCGVRLQQIAGRDKKVDIKPFIVKGLPMNITPTEIVSVRLSEKQVRILSLPEMKDHLDTLADVQFKQFNSITDYHSMMFDLGVLPKRLRSATDRSKYYRLIEASLYGGISSAITRSLRDYLLPENAGVRKAFQDMEAALRENRMTLEAIRVTQRDRNLFKHLITASTDYVSADYMRHVNERRTHIEHALGLRNEFFSNKKHILEEQSRQIELIKSLHEETEAQQHLETEYQSSNEQLNLVQTALRQQEKIDHYQEDIDELRYRLEEQTEIVTAAEEKYQTKQARIEEAELEVDEIKNQLANYQQALDTQQTRALQYQQALQALEKAQTLCDLPDLTSDNVEEFHSVFLAKEQELTEQLFELEQTVNIAGTASDQFDKAYDLVKYIEPNVTQETAWTTAKAIIKTWTVHLHQAEYADTLRQRQEELVRRHQEKCEAEAALSSLNELIGRSLSLDELDELKEALQSELDEIQDQDTEYREQQLALKQEMMPIQAQITGLKSHAPAWFKAQDALLNLRNQSDMALETSADILSYMQNQLTRERELSAEKESLNAKRQQLEEQITQLSQPNGAVDSRLLGLADRFNGVLLSEIYDDVSLDDAPYFSALYGPSRQAIVVSDLAFVRSQLDGIEDCPEDIYFIEGDLTSFDDSVFDCEEKDKAVLVKNGDRQWRYSRFPTVPLFGRAAREKHLAVITAERDSLSECYAACAFELQKLQRIRHHFSQFIGEYLSLAFEENPETKIIQLQERHAQIEKQLHILEAQIQTYVQKRSIAKTQWDCLLQLESYRIVLQDTKLGSLLDSVSAQLEKALVSENYIKQNNTRIIELEPLVPVLKSVPDQHEQLLAHYQEVKQAQRQAKAHVFALNEVISRRSHFSYSDAVFMVDEKSDLNETLRHRLTVVERERNEGRETVRHYQHDYHQATQTLASLKSAYETKYDMLQDLIQEVNRIGLKTDANSEQKARTRRDAILQKLTDNRAQCTRLEKQLLLCEHELESLQKKIKRSEREYHQLRQQIVQAKITWCAVMRLVKDNQIERRLHRRDFAYLSANELRSMSDKALGALRQAVADNEHLRDILRVSEDAKYIEGKVRFYLAVYTHLRERIRQDIIKTDDPIDAIEQMEIELARLTEELTSREQKLAISAKSVANIIRKTIQREQNRIFLLNQGLQSVIFGQVNGVRLNVTLRESHAVLLTMLADQQEQHQDLFTHNQITFSEALAKLYQRLNPYIDMGQRTAQAIGEELLDYRNYLVLDVEVNRGTEGWLRAESGALSTGEAIGTGMSILLMVMQSWEEESKRLRSKDILPCRLLFLDEAARLDAKSISTLFELCERLSMQLIIAAPENISPEKGTTYKLVRKVINNQEHVHVVGLRGFA